MVEKKLFAKTLPVLLGFFVMGFCDIVGMSSDYAASAFGWSATMARLIPSVVFVWFFLLGVPFGLMMNRIGRKNTVLTSMTVTVVGMAIPLLHYDSVTTLAAYALLGIGNAMLQVSLNPLLQNVVTDERLLIISLTAGQAVKAISSFAGPFIVLAAVNWLGGGNEGEWYVLTLPGTVIDENYSLLLLENKNLSLTDAVLLDSVQKGKRISPEAIAMLRKRKLIEGRLPHIFIAKDIAQVTDQKIEYSKHKGLDDRKCEALLLDSLKDHGSLMKPEIVRLLWDVLPDQLDDKQKNNKLDYLLKRLRKAGKIWTERNEVTSVWHLTEK